MTCWYATTWRTTWSRGSKHEMLKSKVPKSKALKSKAPRSKALKSKAPRSEAAGRTRIRRG